MFWFFAGNLSGLFIWLWALARVLEDSELRPKWFRILAKHWPEDFKRAVSSTDVPYHE